MTREYRQEQELSYLFLFSAKSQVQLQTRYSDLLQWIEEETVDIGNIAYTLAIGRSHFNIRDYIIAKGYYDLKTQLIEKLEYLQNGSKPVSHGDNHLRKEPQYDLKEIEAVLDNGDAVSTNALEILGEYYASGHDYDYEKVFKNQMHQRIPMPTYPFKKNKYWCERKHIVKAGKQIVGKLIDENISNIDALSFVKTLYKSEFFLSDHIVNNICVLPGVAQIEMVAEAINAVLTEKKITSIEEVTWHSTIALDGEDEKAIRVLLYPDLLNNKIYFEITDSSPNSHILYSEGIVVVSDEYKHCTSIPIQHEKISRALKRTKGSHLYNLLENGHITLKDSFQSVVDVYANANEALAYIELPAHLQNEYEEYIFHPTILDGVFEAAIMLVNKGEDDTSVALPYKFSRMVVYNEIPPNCISYLKKSDSRSDANIFDVCIAKEDGEIVAEITGFTFKEIRRVDTQNALTSFVYTKEESSEWDMPEQKLPSRTILLIGADSELEYLLRNLGHTAYTVDFGDISNDRSHFNLKVDEYNSYKDILNELENDNVKIDMVIYSEKCIIDEFDMDAEACFMLQLNLINAFSSCGYESIRGYWLAYNIDILDERREANIGLYKTVRLEMPKFIFSVLTINCKKIDTLERIMQIEYENDDVKIDYQENSRSVYVLCPQEHLKNMDSSINLLQDGDTYCITGGTGKIGMLFAYYLASRYKANILLLGRKPADSDINKKIEQLSEYGSKIRYASMNLNDYNSIDNAITNAEKALGKINGVLHCAGITIDSYMKNKDRDDVKQVFLPKVLGLELLHKRLETNGLRFFSVFSSIASIVGNFGQADYAYANAYMDAFIAKKSINVPGIKYSSINWGFWEDGGMELSQNNLAYAQSTLGLLPMNSRQGINEWEKLINSSNTNTLLFCGDKNRFMQAISKKDKASAEDWVDLTTADSDRLRERLIKSIKATISSLMGINENDIDIYENIETYGFNSLTLEDLTSQINRVYSTSLNPTIIFQYPTILSLTEYLLVEYGTTLTQIETHEQSTIKVHEVKRRGALKERLKVSSIDNDTNKGDIAIIGFSGHMPESKNLEEFWEHLIKQQSLSIEVPLERWDYKRINENNQSGQKSISRYGCFIDNVDKFDYELFRINPREASLMDPQQRLFMQSVWSTIENAGYSPSSLQGSRTGVFVGVATNDYQELMEENGVQIEAYSSTGVSHSILANRVSHFFGFHGPSEPINTACSSSLVAIHRSIQSIYAGDCEIAIAGGINLMLNPTLHISFSRSGMLASDGKCKTFDKDANGYVRGEGVGSILLKPLNSAVRDGDYIHAVIKGSAINHGGKVSSLTVPNPVAQIDVLKKAYARSGVSVENISYIEAHGTGTSLGDPIEINALIEAFKQMSEAENKALANNYCAISSVKTNIGHLEAAAGIASVIKVILAMQHRKIPGLANFQEKNPYISLETSPFYLAETTHDWLPESTDTRIAGVSSFGFGGVNAHVVIEEYQNIIESDSNNENPFILSAMTKKQLKIQAKSLCSYLATHAQGDSSRPELTIENIAYTLCIGREDMYARAGFISSGIPDLIVKLQDYTNDIDNAEILEGYVEVKLEKQHQYAAEKSDLSGSLSKWISGEIIIWDKVFHNTATRIPLPGYPFSKTSCWFNKSIQHPMIDQDITAGDEFVYQKTLYAYENYLKDHIVGGKVLLPGVAYLEMVREAAKLSNISVVGLKDINWKKTIEMEEDRKEIYINISASAETWKFAVYSYENSNKIIHADGHILTEEQGKPSCISISEIISRSNHTLDKKACYEDIFKEVGFQYGPFFKVTEKAYCGNREGLAHIILPAYLEEEYDNYTLHPSILDGAVRSVSWVGKRTNADLTLRVPYHMGSIEIFSDIPAECYAYAVLNSNEEYSDSSGMKTYDITITNLEGYEVARITEFAIKQLNINTKKPFKAYTPIYCNQPLGNSIGKQYGNCLLIVCSSDAGQREKIEECIADKKLVFKKTVWLDGDDWGSINSQDLEDNDTIFCMHARNIFDVSLLPTKFEDLLANQDKLLDTGIKSLYRSVKALSKHRTKTRYVFGYSSRNNPYHDMNKGFINSLLSDHFDIRMKAVQFEGTEDMYHKLLDELLCEDYSKKDIRYISDSRTTRSFTETPIEEKGNGFVPNGTYLISGATGALGRKISKYLAQQYSANLILIGRITREKFQDHIDLLSDLGSSVYYISADLNHTKNVDESIQSAKCVFGAINGVISCGGVGTEKTIYDIKVDEFNEVIATKINGTINLHIATLNEPLDFFILFSSISSEIGDMGSCCYSTANMWLDSFVQIRDAEGHPGRTISIKWPLWENGNYILSEEQKGVMQQYYGLDSIHDDEGMIILDDLCKLATGEYVPITGDSKKFESVFTATKTSNEVTINIKEHYDLNEYTRVTTEFLVDNISRTLKISKGYIKQTERIDNYGLDSIMIMELNDIIANEFPGIPKTLFYEFEDISSLAKYLVEKYHDHSLRIWQGARENIQTNECCETHNYEQFVDMPTVPINRTSESLSTVMTNERDIAIIGISGRFPMADNVNDFWDNLLEGKDCIVEIPKSRWDYAKDYDRKKGKKGKIYTKYGGFLNDIDKFDAKFFQMTPRDAILTDPQERLFLECAYHTLEDAGYTRKELAKNNVGVFVGAMYGHYQIIGTEANINGDISPPNSSFASIANRVSYLFDFRGPSLAVDTMCSSSLTSIHLACDSIRSGECEIALAGGVNVTIHKNKYIFLCSQRFASSEGKCRAFGEGGDGYVAGEGVGSVLLKPLRQAVKDHDNIYGVIRADSSNAGGKTSGYSVPNLNAQVDVIKDTLAKGQISPSTISYVEAHGTGTALGDPIEISALTKAFQGDSNVSEQSCAIGSVKSNIGHLESAAGVASLIKVLLQMKYKTLVPSIHSLPESENIDFTQTPFFVQREVDSWSMLANSQTDVRRAAISSFGAGGSNVHMIVDEYIQEGQTQSSGRKLFIFSASNHKTINKLLKDFSIFLSRNDTRATYSTDGIAYTLQTGREAKKIRVAIIAKSIEELSRKIEMVMLDSKNEDIFINESQSDNTEVIQELTEAEIVSMQLSELARLWVNGAEIDWGLLYSGSKPYKITLPGYPFDKQSYWIQQPNNKHDIHPLIDVNISTLKEQKFRKTFYESDHIVHGYTFNQQTLLPSSAFLELAYIAGTIAGEGRGVVLKSVQVIHPFVMDQKEKDLFISLSIDNGEVVFCIYSQDVQEKIDHCRGIIKYIESTDRSIIRIPEVIDQPINTQIDTKLCFKALNLNGFSMGNYHQVISSIWKQDDQLLVKLELSDEMHDFHSGYTLNPALLDGALSTLVLTNTEQQNSHVLFELAQLNVYQVLPKICYALLRHSSKHKNIFDIIILAPDGEVLAELSRLSLLTYQSKQEKAEDMVMRLLQDLKSGKRSEAEVKSMLGGIL